MTYNMLSGTYYTIPLPNFSIIAQYVVVLCEYVFSIGFPL